MTINNIPIPKVIDAKIFIILVFRRPEYLKIWSSLFLKNSIKKNCVASKKIKGSISKINAGEFRKAKYKVKKESTSIVLKKSSSESRLRINIKLNMIKNKFRKDFKKIFIINFV